MLFVNHTMNLSTLSGDGVIGLSNRKHIINDFLEIGYKNYKLNVNYNYNFLIIIYLFYLNKIFKK